MKPICTIIGICLATVCFLVSSSAYSQVPSTTATSQDDALAKVISTVDGYYSACGEANWVLSHSFLSSVSKQLVPVEKWSASFGEKKTTPLPEAAVNYLLPGAEEVHITNLSISGNEAKAFLEATYSLPQQIELIKEENEWKIDLSVNDSKSIEAAVTPLITRLSSKVSDKSLPPNAHMLLKPFIVSHHISQVEMQENRAKVAVIQKAVVIAAMTLKRRGLLWEIVTLPPPITEAKPPLGTSLLTSAATAQQQQPILPEETAEPKEDKPEKRDWLPGPRHWRP